MNILVILHVQCYNNKNWSNITVWYKKHILTQSTDFKSCSTNIFHHSHGNIWFCWFILFSRNPRKRVHLYSQIWMKLMLTKVILRVRHFAVFFFKKFKWVWIYVFLKIPFLLHISKVFSYELDLAVAVFYK